jgi:hypothetical protein
MNGTGHPVIIVVIVLMVVIKKAASRPVSLNGTEKTKD